MSLEGNSLDIGGECPLKSLLVILTTLMLCNAALSAELFGTVDAFSGSAYVEDQSGKSTAVTVGLNIYEGQAINSGPDGEVHLVTEDGGIIAIRPNTLFRIDEYKAEGNSTDKIFMSLLKGAVRSITGWVGKYNTSAYRITTPTATIGIRGTDHETTVIENGNGDEPGTYDSVNEGSTVLKTPQGTAEVTPGKFVFAARGKAAAPIFLAQRPRYFAMRRLKIEERIQQRKEFLRTRLEHMREDRIRTRGNRPKQLGERGSNERQPGQRTLLERRTEFRRHRLEQAEKYQAARGKHGGPGLEKNRNDNIARPDRSKQVLEQKNSVEERKRRYHARERERLKRE